MDAASGLPPWHMVTQNAVPDDGIDCLVDGAEKKVTVLSEARSEKAGPVLCCASAAVDCMPACSCASIFVLAPVEKGMQVTNVFSSSGVTQLLPAAFSIAYLAHGVGCWEEAT